MILFFLITNINFPFLSCHHWILVGGSETESAKVPVNSFSAHLVICVITSHILGIIKVSEAVEFMVPLSNNSSRPLHSCHDLPAGWIMCVRWTLPLGFPRGWTCQWRLRTWCGKRCAYLGEQPSSAWTKWVYKRNREKGKKHRLGTFPKFMLDTVKL